MIYLYPFHSYRIRDNSGGIFPVENPDRKGMETVSYTHLNGPKNGMMFVTPTTTLMSIAYGMRSAVIPTKHRLSLIHI